VVRRQFHKQPDLRIETEGEYTERDAGVQPDLGPERVIRVRGPNELPKRTATGEQHSLGLRDLPPIQFKQHAQETSAEIWDAFVAEWGLGYWYCGTEKGNSRRELQLDHIEPNMRDGSNDDCWNCALACVDCNGDKSNRLTVEETMQKALEAGRIATKSRRGEQEINFQRRHQWAQERWERIKAGTLL
jgi:hypothetical protein